MKQRKKTDCIVWHHSESPDVSLSVLRSWHTAPWPLGNGWEDIGYHKIIHDDGHVENGRDITLVGSHAYGVNSRSIGVVLMGNFAEDGWEPSLEQMNAAAGLYHSLCRFYGKRLTNKFHRGLWYPMEQGKLSPCPGRRLDREDFLETVYRANPYV